MRVRDVEHEIERSHYGVNAGFAISDFASVDIDDIFASAEFAGFDGAFEVTAHAVEQRVIVMVLCDAKCIVEVFVDRDEIVASFGVIAP